MKPTRELASRSARWSGPIRWRRHFELRVDGDQFAALSWENASGELAVARTAEGAWTFQRRGVFAQDLVIHQEDTDHEVATFRCDWRGNGRLECAGGRTYLWGGANLWMTRWVFRDADGQAIVEFRVDPMRLVPSGGLTLTAAGAKAAEAPLLVTLGWYLAVLALDDAGVAAGAAAGF